MSNVTLKATAGSIVRDWARENLTDEQKQEFAAVLKDGARGRLPQKLIDLYNKKQRKNRREYIVGTVDEKTYRVGNKHVPLSEMRKVTGQQFGPVTPKTIAVYKERVSA